MRKSLIWAFLLLLFLSACSHNGTSKPGQSDAKAAEQTALEFMTIYYNGSDEEAKAKFVKERIHPDVQMIFSLGVSSDAGVKPFDDPAVVGSSEYVKDGEKGTVVLLKNSNGLERIVFFLENKIAWVFNSDNTDPSFKESFDKMKASIK
ncbi:hypothetical protein [Paenibacillus sp. NPDC058071]|uniref:hypothetical protein n=1 Tax=Paenibacillus sp. NPDC058071 TaxID=3346326 RepID=UPI0036DBDD50